MTRPCYFVVAGRAPMLFWDELPRTLPRGLEYVVRLDLLPDGERLTRTPLRQLYGTYRALRRKGTLPPRWEPPPRPPAAQAQLKLGHRESQAEVVQRTRQINPEGADEL